MALLVGSPAIDAGPSPVASFAGNQFDQRGTGFARVVGSSVDIGAFEFGATTPTSSSSTTTTASSSTTTTDSSGAATAISYDGPTPDTSSALPTTGSDSRMLIEFGIGAALLGSGMAAVAARRRQSLTFDPNNKS